MEDELEAQLAGVTGAARVAPLLRLAQLRSNRYVRTPTGSPAAGAVLDQAIGNLREVSDLMPPDDPGRMQVNVSLGWLLATRHSGHGGPPADRDRAIELLSGSVDAASLPSAQQQGALLILGQLSALRALHGGPGGALDMSPGSRADLDRAHDCLTRVVAAGPVNEQIRQAAEAMLQLVTMMRDMFGGLGQGNVMANFNHLMGMMSRMGSSGFPSSVPVGMPTIVEGTAVPSRPSVKPAPADPMRETLLNRLASWTGTDDVTAMLRPSTPVVPWADADEAVAMATVVGDGALLAVTLWLRARADDGGGWDGDPGASATADRAAALDALPPHDPLAAALLGEDPVLERREEVTAALRAKGIDALAFAHPVGTLVLDRDGKLSLGVRPAPDRRRIVCLAPAEGPSADVDAVVWTVGSLDRLLRTGQTPEIDANPVFVANPAGDRDQSTVEAMVLRRMLYPRSTGLGNTAEQIDGPATPEEVLAHLPGASLLHLGCAIRTTEPAALGLGRIWLKLRRLPECKGGLVVLPADAGADPRGLLAVADALLDAGMGGAVHWLRPVPPPVASLILYRLHEFLVDDRLPPPDAVAATKRWMRAGDPPRCAPTAEMPDPEWASALSYRA